MEATMEGTIIWEVVVIIIFVSLFWWIMGSKHKYLNNKIDELEQKMVEIHNHLVDSIDTYYKDTVNNLSDLREEVEHLDDMLQSAQDSRNAIHLKLDNLQQNWSDLENGSIQVLTIK